MVKHIITKALVGAALFAAPAFAEQDFLAEVTQGLFSDTTKGIYALTDTEKEKVLGGYSVSLVELRNDRLIGNASIVEIGAMIKPSTFEKDYGVTCGLGSSTCRGNSSLDSRRYRELASLANPDRNEYLVATATKTTRSGAFGVSIPSFTYGFVVFNANTGWIRRTNGRSYVGSEVMQRYKNQLGRILVTQYR